MENDRITIIVPVYNVEQYLPTCMDSILRQDYRNLQIILVDDGSTDSSPEICDAYAEKDCRITVIHQKNAGLSAARNVGLDIAEGKYVAFVDSDDFVSDNYISTMLQLMGGAANRIVCVGYGKFGDETLFQQSCTPPPNSQKLYDSFEAIKLLLYDRERSIGDYAWNKLYPLVLFNDIHFPNGSVYEDVGTTYLLFKKCAEVIYSPQLLYWYRQRADSIVHTRDPKFYRDLYALSKARYFKLTEAYGEFKENYICMMNIIFGYHRYLEPKELPWADHELGLILKKIHVRPKNLVKYVLLKCNKRLLYFLQDCKRNCRNRRIRLHGVSY